MFTSVDVNQDMIKKMLSLSDNRFEDIMSSKKKSENPWKKIGLDDRQLDCMSTKALISFLNKNPCLLKSPIVFDDKNLVSGFNADEIRVFIPRKQRVECFFFLN